MRYFTFSVFLLLWSFKLVGQISQPQTASAKLEQILNNPFFDTTLAGIHVYDLESGRTLFARNEKMLLHPASNMKIFTSAAALTFLGADFVFKTPVYYTGEIKDGVLEGDIYFQGGGDPDFTVEDFDILLSKMKSFGIRELRGALYADISLFDSLYWGKGWMWDDDPSTDAPYLSPLVLNKNSVRVSVSWVPGSDSYSTTMIPENRFVHIYGAVVYDSSRQSALSIDRKWFERSNEFLVSGVCGTNSRTAAKNQNIISPALFFLQAFFTRAEKAGLRLQEKFEIKPVPADAKILHVYSRDLLPVLTVLNKNSDNLSAELALRSLPAYLEKKRNVSTEQGLAYIDSLIALTGMPPRAYRIVDGSGVSHYNLVSPELQVSLLRYMYRRNVTSFNYYKRTFPVGGIDGTLAKRMKGMECAEHVFAKTGTLSGVSCLSGYIETRSGRTLCFSIMMQNHYNRLAYAQYLQDVMCNILFND